MRPIVAWAGVLAVSLGASVGCGDDDEAGDDTVPATVAVGGVLDAFPVTEPEPVEPTASAATMAPPIDVPATTAAPVPTARATTTTTTTTIPGPTTFAEVLADLVGGGPGSADQSTERLTDDTGRLSVAVPEAWSDRATGTSAGTDASAPPYLAASPDLSEFLDGYDAPGLTAVVLPGDDPAEALESFRFGQDCDPDRVRPFVGARLTGDYRVWRDCGGTGTAIVTVAVEPDRSDGTVLVLGQIREHDDLVALDIALATMRVTD